MDAEPILAANAVISTACLAVLWLAAIALKDISFIDTWWALGLALMAWASFFLTGGHGPHAVALVALCSIWGLRLGAYLFWRWRREGPDRRYVTMLGKARDERGWSFAKASLMVVIMQGPVQFVVGLPVILGQATPTQALGPLAYGGIGLALVGVAFESIGDLQLARFRADPANAGKVLDSGLWRYTRHPNYFGDACVWWGLYLIAADTGPVGALTLVAPVLMTLLLTRWSGAPLLEGRMRRRRPDYEAYVRRTSGFIPLPPKRV